jgi:hypothetical protein
MEKEYIHSKSILRKGNISIYTIPNTTVFAYSTVFNPIPKLLDMVCCTQLRGGLPSWKEQPSSKRVASFQRLAGLSSV